MVHATKFLLRWIYLNNLIYDRAEIQSLPYLHPSQVDQFSRQQQQYSLGGGGQLQQIQQEKHHHYQQQQQQQIQTQPTNSRRPNNNNSQEQVEDRNDREWKRQALRTIALYPPGTPRLLALDSLRLELVHELARRLHDADGVIQSYNKNIHVQLKKRQKQDENNKHDDNDSIAKDHGTSDLDGGSLASATATSQETAIDLDTDDEIIKEFQEATSCSIDNSNEKNDGERTYYSTPSAAASAAGKSSPSPNVKNINPLNPQLKRALELQRETRDYLPQFVSAILHSPPPLTTTTTSTAASHNYQHHHYYQQQQQQQFNLDPIATLRKLIINRCMRDPNLGIELCWLLEAEVGRAWKTLFEHRQQTGRRLIIVLPADKAAVLAKIGSEKRSAFDLLQDVESATAYGVYSDGSHYGYVEDHQHHHYNHGTGDGSGDTATTATTEEIYSTPRLPASLSMKRCSHFGDTMHFIDRLTKISLDLRLVPTSRREQYLEDSLEELNRRLRRRMVTEGNVSLDVEDNLGPYDWPSLREISFESLKYSVHLPLEPTATTWPGKHGPERFEDSSPLLALKTEHGVMRVLNIVSSKCRILASRERCPFLVHCEVLETGREGSDARLYANGSGELGATLQEALGVAASRKKHGGEKIPYDHSGTFPPYHIPSELSTIQDESASDEESVGYVGDTETSSESNMTYETNENQAGVKLLLRGGDQEGYSYSGMDDVGYHSSSPYDLVQEEQLQQLHEHLQSHQHHPHYGPPSPPPMPYPSHERPKLTTYSSLLDRVFGSSWVETSEEIRKTSPYGNVKGWRLASFIMKAGEDIRREALVMQVISKMKQWFEEDIPEHNRPYLKPYTILCVGGDAGLLECIRDAKSIDEVKKNTDGFTTLREYFERAYGPPTKRGRQFHQPSPPNYHPFSNQHQQMNYYQSGNIHQTIKQMQQQLPISGADSTNGYHTGISFETAQDNFLRSLVGYSLICYILQIKDRHNANILLDREGHIMHIDFGFVLGDTPKMAKVPIFSERAPFKLTAEFWEVIGGWNFNDGGLGVKFCKMFEEAFYCAASHSEELATMVESAILNLTQNPNMARIVANGVRTRLQMKGGKDSIQQKTFIMNLVNTALTSWGTSTYDWLQKSMNGYI